MIEATCGACGTVARIAEADVPMGAKFVTCASCKSRVALPQSAAAKPAIPGVKPPAIPPKIPGKTPTPPAGIAASKAPTVDLADLPAPKRGSALAGVEGGKAAPKSPLGGAELPAPKAAKPPAAAPGALDLDDLMPSDKGGGGVGLADLPAPKSRGSALADAPAASKPVASPLADLPAPKAKPSALADLPAPKAKAATADLGLPAPKAKGGGSLDLDLPAPKAKGAGSLDLDDLPAPSKGGVGDFSLDGDLDLPAPTGKAGVSDFSLDGDLDLPAPKDGIADLPMPKPGAASDLPAPKGFFDDLPAPSKKAGGGSLDLPAPKGFFDDLPAPSKKADVSDLPAPKQQGGFFDDLPQPARPEAAAAKGGFFDDLPQPAKPGAKPAAAKPGGAGLFDDLDQPAAAAAEPMDLRAGDIDLGPMGADSPLELDGGGGGGNALDLGLPLAADQSFSELDLSEPTSGKKPASAAPDEPPSPIKIKTPGKGGGGRPIPITVKKDEKQELKLDLADDPHAKGGAEPAATSKAGGAAAKGKAKKVEKTPEELAAEAAAKKKKQRIVLAGLLGVALLGSGGFYFYKKHAASVARQEEIDTQLATARRQMGETAPNHWSKAATAANRVIELAPNDGRALGLAAEAALAGALDTGANFDTRVKQGRKLVQDGLGAGKRTPEIERAQALMHIAANESDKAIQLLQGLLAKSPKDGWLSLYMGWAQLGKGDAEAALKAFDDAAKNAPATKISALYGQGNAKLLQADLEGARAAFSAVVDPKTGNKDHVGAIVGLAATLPPQQTAQREAELLSVLQRDDVKQNKADPRAVVTAYDLAGDIARQSGRLDIARERYRKAIAISKLDIPAHVGLATVELKDNKPQVAADLIAKALTVNPNNPEVQLLAALLDVEQGKLSDAKSKIEKLDERKPPLPPLLGARLFVVKGKLAEKEGRTDDAIAAYTEGAKLAGELDLTPTMAAVTKLTDLSKTEADPAKAAGYKKSADDLLGALSERAKEDGELSLTLGVAYLQAGDAVKAEENLRRANTLREKDPETKLQLAKALSAQGKTDEAITQLNESLAIDPKRIDVQLELARTYRNAGRDNDAMGVYDKLLADPAVPIVARADAGKWCAMKGERKKAADQAEPILKDEPDNAAGLYLKAEGLMLAKKWDEARPVLQKATTIDDSDAQYLDALGRAFEGSYGASNDRKFIESARYAYERATKADPKMFHPWLGLGHMLVESSIPAEAIKALEQANKLDPNNREVDYWMGLASFGLRNEGAARRQNAAGWLEAALKGESKLSEELRAEGYWRLGQLYVDLNKAPAAAAAMEQATKMGEEMEKQTGKGPDWLTELYYDLGDMYYKLNNKPGQKRAWQRYVDRKPKPGVRKTEAERALATSLKGF